MRLRLNEWASRDDGVEIWPVYDSVFSDYPDVDGWLEAVWDRHRTRAGFRLVRAYSDDALTGFAYGYTGEHGQWWTDNARDALEPDTAEEWLGGHFEVVSIGVTRNARGHGTGRNLMAALCRDLPHERLLLMTTADATDPARRLYQSDGWQVLGGGIGLDTVIMGRLGKPATAS